jgi:hypothetical protein
MINMIHILSKYFGKIIFSSFFMILLFAGNNYAQIAITNLDGDNVTFIEDGSVVVLDLNTDVTVINSGPTYNGGNLTVSVSSSNSNDDILIETGGDVELSDGMNEASTVTVSSTLIGQLASGGTGQDGSNLVITLNANATNDLLETLIDHVEYSNDSNDPPSSRIVNLTLTNSGPETSNSCAITVSITGVNDPPTLTATGTDPTFTEDGPQADLFNSITASTIESGQTITELILTVTNVNDGSDEILSIDESSVELTNANSLTTTTNSIDISVSLSGSTATITLSKAAGLSVDTLQSIIDRMTYRNENNTPNTSNRVVTLTSIKDNGGTDNSGVDTSILSIVSTITVVASNDAPVLDTTPSPALTGITEELGAPSDGSTDNSTLVSALVDEGGALDNFSDVEGDSPGIAVIDVNSGTLWYSTNDGTNWTELTGTISETSALVLFADAGTRLYYEPNANVSGTVSDALVIKAWDRTSGQSNGTTAANTTAGTSFSTNTDDVSIDITDTNDPPTLSLTPNDPTFSEGDSPVGLFSGVSFSTVEAGQNILSLELRIDNIENDMDEILYIDGSDVGLGIGDSVITADHSMKVMVTNKDTSNTWTYVTITDTLTTTVGYSATIFQDILENMTYQNTSSQIESSTRKIVIFSAKDDGGTASGGIDSVAYLDSTTVTIIGVNNQPVLDNAKSPEFNGVPENINDPTNGSTLYSTLVSEIIDDERLINTNTLDNYSDGDSDPSGLAVIGVNLNGTLWYSTDDGSSWAELSGTISETSALVVYADNSTRLYYKPDNGVSGTVNDAITIKAWDRTSGETNGTISVNTTTGSSFSVDTDDVEITVADINYAPNLSATGLNPDFTEGGAAVDLFSTVNAETPEAGQSLIELQFTVSNVLNGGDESLMIDGIEVELTNGNSLTTLNNGMTVEVSLSSYTATITVSKAGGVSETIIENIIDGLTYKNNSNNPGNTKRTVTLISLQDDGGSANGSDTGTYSITSDVSILPINEPPVIANLNGDNAYIVAGGTTGYIDVNQDALVTNSDSPDNCYGSIIITQTSGTENGTWSFDGSVLKSGVDATIDTSETIFVNGIEIGNVSATNDGEAGDTLVINFNDNSTNTRVSYLINYLKYSVPSGLGERVFSLTLDDGDGNLNGGDSSSTVSFTVTTTQNPPVITGLNGDSQSYVKGSELILDDGLNANVTDSDSPDFDGGNLTISISSGLQTTEDVLLISTDGPVSLSAGMTVGSNVIVEAVTIGAISSAGSSGNDLVITFNSNSTIARIVSLLRSIAYKNLNNDSPSIDTRVIDFTLSDGAGVGSAVSEISQVEVILNSNPTTSGIPDIQVASNAPNSNIDLSQNFDDEEEDATTLNYTIENISSPGLFTTVFISGYTLVLDYGLSTNGTSNITIRATDSGGLYCESVFKVTVGTGINPIAGTLAITVNNGGSVIENGTLFINTQMLCAENPNGNSASLTYIVTQPPQHGTLQITGSLQKKSSVESFSFTQQDLIDGKVEYVQDGSEANADTIKFIVSDDDENSTEEKSFIITITAVNDAPVVKTLTPIIINEDQIYTFNISAWFDKIDDPDNPDSTLSILLTCDNENVTLSSTDNKTYTITPKENYFGSATVFVVISDGELSANVETQLIVQSVNDLPVIENLPTNITFSNNSTYSLSMFDYIGDLETPDSLLNISFSTTPDSILSDYKHKTGALTLFVLGSFTGNINLSITVIDEEGGTCSESIELTIVTEPNGIEKIDGMPTEFVLYQNYPNPFNPTTIIRYGIPLNSGNSYAQQVSLKVYDILGREVASLVNMEQSPGYYEKSWNASRLSSGIYIYVLAIDNAGDGDGFRAIKKMILLR